MISTALTLILMQKGGAVLFKIPVFAGDPIIRASPLIGATDWSSDVHKSQSA